MPTNHTPNYRLSQWERTDKILMDDFNADNAKIDAVLGEHAAKLAKCGNCQVTIYTYTGHGKSGANYPTVIPFPKGTTLLLILNTVAVFQALYPGISTLDFGGPGYRSYLTWTDTSVSIYSERGPIQQFSSTVEYLVLSFQKIGEE